MTEETDVVLLREQLGHALRASRLAQGRTLRQVAAEASVSLGYLSEIERGEKEASSEMLNAICAALGEPVSVLLHDVADRTARAEGVTLESVAPVVSAA